MKLTKVAAEWEIKELNQRGDIYLFRNRTP